MSEQIPSVGRIVHYVPSGPDPECWPAMITSADGACELTLFPPGRAPVPLDRPISQGSPDDFKTWHWPERV